MSHSQDGSLREARPPISIPPLQSAGGREAAISSLPFHQYPHSNGTASLSDARQVAAPHGGYGAAPPQLVEAAGFPSAQQTPGIASTQQLRPPPKFTPMQRVQLWNQYDSGVQSMSHSSANSIMSMSSIHAASQISGVSSLPSVASGAEPGGDYYGGTESNDQLQLRFQNIPSSFQHGNREKARRALLEIIPLLTDTAEEVVCKALSILKKIANFDFENPNPYNYTEPAIRERVIIDGLLHGLRTYSHNKKIVRLAVGTLFRISTHRDGIDLIIQVVQDLGPRCLDDVLNATCVEELSCFKHALLMLHNLMTEKRIAAAVIGHVRETEGLRHIVKGLSNQNEKLSVIVVDMIQLVVDRNSQQIALFFDLDGPNCLIQILGFAQYENLLWRSAKLLKQLAKSNPQRLVDLGTLEVLHTHLNHASQRLVSESLCCLRELCHIRTNERDLSQLLRRLLQLLGSGDLQVRQMCTQILCNLSANNRVNKEFLVRCDVVRHAFFVLFETQAQVDELQRSGGGAAAASAAAGQQHKLNGQLLEDIQDNVLTILRNICSGHALAPNVLHELMRGALSSGLSGGSLAADETDIFLQKLIEKRVVLLRLTLRILCQTATVDANLSYFRRVGGSMDLRQQRLPAYVYEVVQCFYTAACHISTPVIEGVKMAELIQYSMTILHLLARDDFLLRSCQLQGDAAAGERLLLLPHAVLRMGDDVLAARAIELIAELARIPEAAATFLSTTSLIQALRQYSSIKHDSPSPVQQLAGESAERALHWIGLGGDCAFGTTDSPAAAVISTDYPSSRYPQHHYPHQHNHYQHPAHPHRHPVTYPPYSHGYTSRGGGDDYDDYEMMNSLSICDPASYGGTDYAYPQSVGSRNASRNEGSHYYHNPPLYPAPSTTPLSIHSGLRSYGNEYGLPRSVRPDGDRLYGMPLPSMEELETSASSRRCSTPTTANAVHAAVSALPRQCLGDGPSNNEDFMDISTMTPREDGDTEAGGYEALNDFEDFSFASVFCGTENGESGGCAVDNILDTAVSASTVNSINPHSSSTSQCPYGADSFESYSSRGQ